MQQKLFDKGQLISKANQSSQGFSQKTNKNTSHSSKNEFIRSFFGRILGLAVCFRNKLTFKMLFCRFFFKFGIGIWIWAVENLRSSHHVSVVRDVIHTSDKKLSHSLNDSVPILDAQLLRFSIRTIKIFLPTISIKTFRYHFFLRYAIFMEFM